MILPLAPIDYYFYRKNLYTIQFAFEFKGSLNIHLFEMNLARTIDLFPIISSRLKIVSPTEIHLQTGFSIPVSSRTLSIEIDLSVQDNIDHCIDTIENSPLQPLIKFKISKTPSRTIVGVSFSHLLGDGASFFHFLKSLTETIHHRPISLAACNERELLNVGSLPELSSAELFEGTGYSPTRAIALPTSTVEVIPYSQIQLSDKKQKLIAENSSVTINSFLMADLTKRFYKNIPLYQDNFIVRCPVDYRKIFHLPPGYFGNAVRDAVTIFDFDELNYLTVSEIARRIHDSIQSIDKSSVQKSLKCLSSLREHSGIDIFENIGCPGLLVSNLSKFPITEIDLGLGAPIGFHHASLNSRLGLILPNNDGVLVKFKRPLLTL